MISCVEINEAAQLSLFCISFQVEVRRFQMESSLNTIKSAPNGHGGGEDEERGVGAIQGLRIGFCRR